MEGEAHEIVDVYVAYLNDVNQLRTSRQTDNTTRLGVVTLLLGGQAFLINSALTDVRQAQSTITESSLIAWVPIIAIALVGFVGCYFCHNWRRLLEDTQRTLNFKFSNLEDMERGHPVLQLAGAQLFLKERADRHKAGSTNTVQDLAENSATGEQAKGTRRAKQVRVPRRTNPFRRRRSGSKRGVSKRATDLARFFFWLFLFSSGFALAAKTFAVFGSSWLTGLGIRIHL